MFFIPKILRSDYIRVVLVDKHNRERSGMAQIVDGRVTIKNKSYRVLAECIYRQGMFRVPTSYYIVGKSGPIDLRGKITMELDADEEYERMEAKVVQQAFASFSEGLLEDKRMLLLLLIIGAGFAFIYWNFNGQLGDIEALLAPPVS